MRIRISKGGRKRWNSTSLHIFLTSLRIFARSALYVRAHSQNWNVSSFVRSFVRPESNYFLRRGYEGWPRAAGPWCFERSIFQVLNFFQNFWKKVLKVYISMRIAHSKNPVLNQSGPSLMNFWRTFLKLWKRVFDVDCVDEKSRGIEGFGVLC